MTHRALRHGTETSTTHVRPHHSPVRESSATYDPIDLLVDFWVNRHAVILLVLHISHESVV
jgi:hypothetical protein